MDYDNNVLKNNTSMTNEELSNDGSKYNVHIDTVNKKVLPYVKYITVNSSQDYIYPNETNWICNEKRSISELTTKGYDITCNVSFMVEKGNYLLHLNETVTDENKDYIVQSIIDKAIAHINKARIM